MPRHDVSADCLTMQAEDGEGDGEHNDFPFQQIEVPHSDTQTERKTVEETLEEPLESVDPRVDTVCH